MTIKKRLFRSNILMILVPVIATALIGLLCMGFIWFGLIHGMGIGLNDTDEFEAACTAISGGVGESLENSSDLSSIETLLEQNQLTLRLDSDGRTAYTCGEEKDVDSALYAAAALLGNEATLRQNGRMLYAHQISENGLHAVLYLTGSCPDVRSYSDLKTAVVEAGILILLTIFVSILLTNRFLTKFVWRRIEEPLDILVSGVHELRDGNLDYRISYDRQDEFLPICRDFNAMAGRLKEMVQQIQRQEHSRKELIAGISHDIRSPLTSIQAYVEGLLDGVAGTPKAQRRYLETIKSKAEDLAHIVSQLFLFSKMELGECPGELHSLRLKKVLEDIVLPVREEYARRGLLITMDLDEAVMEADPIWLQRITGLNRGLSEAFDLILLDLMLLGMDGFGVCRRLRERLNIPILMVTARQEDIDKIRGLGLGADDYIEKPFSPGVLVARVKANLAQYRRLSEPEKASGEIALGGILLNTGTHRVFADGNEVRLTNREYELLLFLMLNVDMVFDRETLYEKVWGLEAMGDNATVAVHINRLREKLEPDPAHPRYIETVWGAGYRFRGC